MRLERMTTEILREPHGFSFTMQVAESTRTVRIFVADDALEDEDQDVATLRSQFEDQRAALEAIAREKYEHGRVSSGGVIVISIADILGFFE